MKSILNLKTARIAAFAAIFLIAVLFIFAVYKLIVLSGFSIILLLVISALLVAIVAFGMKEASEKLISAGPEPSRSTPEEAVKWSGKQYNDMYLFLMTSLLSASGLLFLGVTVAWLVVSDKNRDFIDLIMGGFGMVIVFLGLYCMMIVTKELRFIKTNKALIVAKIIERVSGS
ncbi:MAG: hypothetical protein PHN57_01220 [Candidatus Omnitrophica bacterium]|nr:hypothetical protein [Candidatus Omnitrophota bacterium]